MKSIKQRIKDTLDEFGIEYGRNDIADALIDHIIKPIVKEAFEAGSDYSPTCISCDQWINENLK